MLYSRCADPQLCIRAAGNLRRERILSPAMQNPLRNLSFDRLPRRRGSTASFSASKENVSSTDGFHSDGATGRAASPGRAGFGGGSAERFRKLFARASSLSSSERALTASPGAAGSSPGQDRVLTPQSSPFTTFATTATTTPPILADVSPPTQTPSVAPASLPAAMTDFLSRESEVLGDDFSSFTSGGASANGTNGDIDLDRAASAFPDINLDNLDEPVHVPPVVSPRVQNGNGLDIGSFGDFPAAHGYGREDVKVTGDDEIDKFEDQFPELDVGGGESFSPPVSQQPSFGVPPPFAPKPQSSAFSNTPILSQPLPDEEEPEVIRAWREKQAEEIRKRDEASAAKRQEAIAKAERSIDQFYEEYSAKKERNIKENKVQEQEYLSTFSDSISAGTTWSRICAYIDLENSQSKTLARSGAGTTDLTRFKEVLLRLKREGESAPGAGGY